MIIGKMIIGEMIIGEMMSKPNQCTNNGLVNGDLEHPERITLEGTSPAHQTSEPPTIWAEKRHRAAVCPTIGVLEAPLSQL